MGMKEDNKAGKKLATASMLKGKKPVSKEVELIVTTDDNKTEEVTLVFQSIGSTAYDDLVAKHPPTKRQKEEKHTFNMDTFAPELLSLTCVEPEMPVEEWQEVWTSDAWNRGELMALVMHAIEVNSRGLELLPPTETD